MADTKPLHVLLKQLSSALDSASSSLPTDEAISPPPTGISLLDVKTELFVSYLQNLVFLILLKLRDHSRNDDASEGEEDSRTDTALHDAVVKKLVELRVYLERGAKPLEGKLKYQLDKVVRAASSLDDRGGVNNQKKSHKSLNGHAVDSVDGDDEDQEEDGSSAAHSDVDDLAYRPNPADFLRSAKSTASRRENASSTTKEASSDGIYRPPRINPTAPPISDRRKGSARTTQRSHAVDDFIDTELSSAPRAEPSIGSTIVSGGRRSKSSRELAVEAERTAYEEDNFVRLPGDSKKERARKARANGGSGMFGGEDLRGLGEGLDRIGRLTGKRKVGRETVDGPRGEGLTQGIKKKKRRY